MEVCNFLILFYFIYLFVLGFTHKLVSTESPSVRFMQYLQEGTRIVPSADQVANRTNPGEKRRFDALFELRKSYLQNGLLSSIYF